ncbi:hypothetical protein CLU79DRAFT_892653 [Phycomyces nitens]|nr:hypothetical protein CLU79DRAFT_892653 [Phycomyces nitens]
MFQESLNNNTNLKFVGGSLQTSGKRGRLNDERKLACIEATLFYHPFEQQQGNIAKAWEKVNNSDPNSHPVGMTVIKKFVQDSRKQIKEKQRKERGGTGTNDSETDLENCIISLDQLMTAAELKKSENDEAATENMIRKRGAEATMRIMALEGTNKKKKEALI